MIKKVCVMSLSVLLVHYPGSGEREIQSVQSDGGSAPESGESAGGNGNWIVAAGPAAILVTASPRKRPSIGLVEEAV